MTARRLALLATLLTALLPASAVADTVQVNTAVDEDDTGPACSLREAIHTFNNSANTGGCTAVIGSPPNQITFAGSLTGGTINLSNDEMAVNVAAPLQIVGPGMSSLTISADIGARVFNVQNGGGAVTISGMTIRDGAPNGAGGAVRGGCVLNNGDLTLTSVHITLCEANITDGAADVFGDGGGVGNTNSLTVNSSLIDDNQARGFNTQNAAGGSGQARGAGIYSDIGTTLIVNDSTIADNESSATDNGPAAGQAQSYAGIWTSGATTTISQSTISGNIADAFESNGLASTSGGMYNNAGAGIIEQSTFVGNIADPNGTTIVPAGAIYSQGTALTIRSSTIAANGPTSVSANGASLSTDGGAVTIANTIIANPRGGLHNCTDIGNIITGGFNDDYSPGGASCFAVPLATDQTANPLLAAAGLANNGGPTQTVALQTTSPMIDAGSNVGNTDLTTDQRGLVRPVDFPGLANAAGGNGTDIGALEVQQACAGQATPATVCPDPPTPLGPTGKRAKALKKCKKIKTKTKKGKQKRKKCIKRAKKLLA